MKKIVLILIYCLSLNTINAQEQNIIDLRKYIKSLNIEKLRVSLSMPVLENSIDSSINWPIKYVILFEDTTLESFCISINNDNNTLMNLVKMLDEEQYDWVANLCLYSITKLNAIELSAYLPSDYLNWRKQRKVKDKEIWNNYLKNK